MNLSKLQRCLPAWGNTTCIFGNYAVTWMKISKLYGHPEKETFLVASNQSKSPSSTLAQLEVNRKVTEGHGK